MGKIQLDEVQPGQEQLLTVGIVEPAATVGTISSIQYVYFIICKGIGRGIHIWFYI